MSRESQGSVGQGDASEGFSPRIGLWKGFTAFVLAFVVIALFLLVEIGGAMGRLGPGAGRLLLLSMFGLTFGSHLGAIGGTSLSTMAGTSTIPVILYYLVPIAFLVWNGRRAARSASARTPEQSAVAGASISLGYLAGFVVSYVLVILMISGYGAGFRISNQLFRPLLVIGIIYPVVFGGIGGFTTTMGGSSARSGNRQRAGGRQQAGAHQQAGTHQQQTQNENQGPTCVDCGATNQRNAAYCNECGSKL